MATTGIMNGTLLGVYSGTTLIAHATESSISLSMDTRDASTKDSAVDTATSLEGSHAVDPSALALCMQKMLHTEVDDLMTLYTARTAVAVKFSTEVVWRPLLVWQCLHYLFGSFRF